MVLMRIIDLGQHKEEERTQLTLMVSAVAKMDLAMTGNSAAKMKPRRGKCLIFEEIFRGECRDVESQLSVTSSATVNIFWEDYLQFVKQCT